MGKKRIACVRAALSTPAATPAAAAATLAVREFLSLLAFREATFSAQRERAQNSGQD